MSDLIDQQQEAAHLDALALQEQASGRQLKYVCVWRHDGDGELRYARGRSRCHAMVQSPFSDDAGVECIIAEFVPGGTWFSNERNNLDSQEADQLLKEWCHEWHGIISKIGTVAALGGATV